MKKVTKGIITATSMGKRDRDLDIITDKIVIKKLFGCTDYTFDFSNECMILIGPNGVGKSTAIKLMNGLLKGDWELLFACEHPFDKIEFFNKDMIIEMPYDEFFPDSKELVDICASQMFSKTIPYSKTKIGKEDIKNIIKHFCEEFIGPEWYSVLANCYRDLAQPERVKALNKKYTKNIAEKFGISGLRVEMDIINGFAAAIKMYVPTTYEDGTTTVSQPFEIQCEDGIKLELPEPYFFIDQTALVLDTEDATDCDSIVNLPIFEDLYELEYSKDKIEAITCKDYKNSIADILENVAEIAKENLIGKNEEFRFRSARNQIHFTYINDQVFDQINVNEIISQFYFSNQFVQKINARFLEIMSDVKKNFSFFGQGGFGEWKRYDDPRFLLKYKVLQEALEPLISEYDEWRERYDDAMKKNESAPMSNILNDVKLTWPNVYSWVDSLKDIFGTDVGKVNIENYFSPILLRNTPFGDFTPEGIDKDLFGTAEDPGPNLNNLLVKYILYKEYIDELKSVSSKSVDIVLLEQYLKKYLWDKEAIITPRGIRFIKKNPDGTIINISQDMLSSGEKKLLVLFAIALLKKGSKIMIDEPEISLSILWQEELLSDILDQPGVESLIVATHSPYIVRNSDRLSKYITYLESEV